MQSLRLQLSSLQESALFSHSSLIHLNSDWQLPQSLSLEAISTRKTRDLQSFWHVNGRKQNSLTGRKGNAVKWKPNCTRCYLKQEASGLPYLDGAARILRTHSLGAELWMKEEKMCKFLYRMKASQICKVPVFSRKRSHLPHCQNTLGGSQRTHKPERVGQRDPEPFVLRPKGDASHYGTEILLLRIFSASLLWSFRLHLNSIISLAITQKASGTEEHGYLVSSGGGGTTHLPSLT